MRAIRVDMSGGPAGNGSLFITWSSNNDHTATREELLWRAGAVFGGVVAGTLHVEVAGSFPLNEAARAHELLERRGVMGKLISYSMRSHPC